MTNQTAPTVTRDSQFSDVYYITNAAGETRTYIDYGQDAPPTVTQPADCSAQIIAQCNASIQATLKTIPATASNATKCHAMQACDRAANAAYRAATAEQAHDEPTRTRNMTMYRTNLDRARQIIRENK